MAGCLPDLFPSHSIQRPKLPFLGMNKSMTIMQKKKKKKNGKFHSCGMIHDIEVKGRKKEEREREKFTALFNGHGGWQY